MFAASFASRAYVLRLVSRGSRPKMARDHIPTNNRMTYSPGECTVVSANEYGVLQALRGEVTRHVVHPTHITYIPPGHAAFITSYYPFEVLDMEGAVCVGPIDMLRHFKPNMSAY